MRQGGCVAVLLPLDQLRAGAVGLPEGRRPGAAVGVGVRRGGAPTAWDAARAMLCC